MSSTDSTSLLRIVNTPARGLAEPRLEQIERHARELGLSLWDAVQGVVDDRGFPPVPSPRCAVPQPDAGYSLVASASPLPEVIRFVLERTGYRKMLSRSGHPIPKRAWRTWTN